MKASGGRLVRTPVGAGTWSSHARRGPALGGEQSDIWCFMRPAPPETAPWPRFSFWRIMLQTGKPLSELSGP
jgi:hypothetical protein